MPSKTSVGVILCRKNAETRRLEALLVHKRYTYAFAEFVHGRYSRGARPGAPRAPHAPGPVAALLDEMSREELLDVYSLSFEQMWYRIWLTHDNRDLFNKKNARFQSAFMHDGGAALRALVLAARGAGAPMWEVPKGRRAGPREPDIACAVRELREETGVDKHEYRLLPGVRRRTNFVSAGTRYISIYFIAVATAAAARSPQPCALRAAMGGAGSVAHLAEISEVRWHDIERVRMLDARLAPLLAPAFRLAQRYLAGKWAAQSSQLSYAQQLSWLESADSQKTESVEKPTPVPAKPHSGRLPPGIPIPAAPVKRAQVQAQVPAPAQAVAQVPALAQAPAPTLALAPALAPAPAPVKSAPELAQAQIPEPARAKKAQAWRAAAESPDDGGPWSVVSRRRVRSMRGHRGALRARALVDALASSEIVSSIVSVTPTWRQKPK